MKRTNVISISLLSVFCFAFIALTYYDDPQNGDINPGFNNVAAVDQRIMDANNIAAWFRNNGSFNRDPVTFNSGFEWPRGSGDYARYASGVWMGCVAGNDTLTAIAEYVYDYLPGYVDDNGNPAGTNDPLYRIYRIDRGDTTSADYQNWPVSQGAYINASGRPFFLGTQNMFYVYTDAYPHSSGQTSLLSLKAQILHTNWCYTNIGLGDVIFSEWKIINRNNQVLNDMYVSFWTDDDLGDATDDAVGCDTARDLGYTYNIDDQDPIYGSAPPAVGTTVLRSPIIATGNNNDTVKYYSPPGSQNLIVKPGYKFAGMTVFNTYNNTTPQPSDPLTNPETYRVLSGKWREGQSWVNPTNNQVTKKVYSGDPVTSTGWRMTNGGDRRFLQGFGPFTMNPGDTQSVIFAQVIARGSSNLNSITALRNLSDQVKSIYAGNFQSVLSVNNISTEIPETFKLYQNYPNPFNPSTTINYSVTLNTNVTLKIFDINGRELQTLVNMKQAPGTYSVTFDGSKFSTGIYYYRIEAGDFKETKKMMLIK